MKKSILVDGVKYVPESEATTSLAKSLKGKQYVIVRTYSAGVFAGYMDKKEGQNAIVLQARRLWFWKGAASLSQLSQEGVTCPNECKFPMEVPSVELDQVIEVLQCSEKARLSIADVPVWKQ